MIILLRISNLKLPIKHTQNDILAKLTQTLRVKPSKIQKWEINKKAIDARNKNNVFFVYNIDLEIDEPEKYINIKDVSTVNKTEFAIIRPNKKPMYRPVIIGSGPAGLFAAFILAESGLCPIVIERGNDLIERKKDVDIFFNTGKLNCESNIQFGFGGAGTFSDGKLTTGIHDIRIKKVLDEFIAAGAPEEIAYLSKPHIGTDKLVTVLSNMRKTIENLGGEFRFSHKLCELKINKNRIEGLVLRNEKEQYYELTTQQVVLAIGHSARDTFHMLRKNNMDIIQKPFAIGMRIEHLQLDINISQYGKYHDQLPTADYKLNTHTKNGRGVFTFCMCPGGKVVAAASSKGLLVTNGMSYYARDLTNANSALLVGISPNDFNSNDPLEGIKFQEELEQKAFILGGGNYKAPVQLLGDFLLNKASSSIGDIFPSYTPGFTPANLQELFPQYCVDSFKEAIVEMDKKLKGFARYDAILTGIESRSSAPLRLVRNEQMESNIAGIFPCGEGSGYAGGIVSAAVDGIKAAEAICCLLNS